MKFYGDYHTHTRYSEGTGRIRDNIEAARAAGLKEIGISDHGYNNVSLSLKRGKLVRQHGEIDRLRSEYPDIKVYKSIEADIIGLDGRLDMDVSEFYKFDYVICGFHRWARAGSVKDFFGYYLPAYMTTFRAPKPKEIMRNTDAALKMLHNYPIAIYAHINSATYVDVTAIAEACADLGVFLELNVKHIVRNLGRENFEKILKTGVEFIASSDAHTPVRIGQLKVIEDFVAPYGIEDRIVNTREKTPDFRTVKNWRR